MESNNKSTDQKFNINYQDVELLYDILNRVNFDGDIFWKAFFNYDFLQQTVNIQRLSQLKYMYMGELDDTYGDVISNTIALIERLQLYKKCAKDQKFKYFTYIISPTT